MTLPGLTRSLKELMERSPLGEFEARLQMLRSFHCHTLYLYPEDSGKERPVTRGRANTVTLISLSSCFHTVGLGDVIH